ncbi:MAG: serine/threonine protein kinase [Cyanobacteria bacterium REEB67]|nr:serine/threonine protein kinase [Cyanobacteria bacterium REEB67]
MAEAELTIKYRKPLVTALFATTTLLFPVAVFVFCWTSLVLAIHMDGSKMNTVNALMLIGFNAFLTALCGFTLFLASDEIIFITRDGINLPFFVCPGPHLRVRKKWENLKNIQFLQSGQRSHLILQFDDGKSADLNLVMLKAKELDALIMALDVWTEGADNFSALLDARTFMQEYRGGQSANVLSATDWSGENKSAKIGSAAHRSNSASDYGDDGKAGGKSGGTASGMTASKTGGRRDQTPGYTQLWQEELARRFGATNFIPLEPGQKVLDGIFTIEKQLAFGGLSAIYLARKNDRTNSRFVLKEAVVPQNEDADMTKKSHHLLSREALMLSALSHEQIARVYDHFVDQGRHYLVIEYIPGQDLRHLVHEEGPQHEEQVIAWGIDMALMLAYLHEQPEPIIHRDFTPDNLLLKNDGSIVVIDFGAANFFLGTATGTMIGKQAYIAPEQLRGKANCQSDIYALGASLYFLSTGEDPEPLSASHPRDKIASLSPAFDKIVADCTQMEREGRPATARLVAERLRALKKTSKAVSHAE